MIQLELYIREIIRFLRTMTIKNEYFKQQMEDNYVVDAFLGKLPDELHPYYRHLLGKCSYKSFKEFRKVAGIPDNVTDGEIALTYGFDYVKILATSDGPITRSYINGSVVPLVYDEIEISSVTYYVYPNCVWYYGQICPVRILYKKFDELMVINSIDTKTVIPFNSTMLNSKQHQKTASLYRMPSRYYTKICEKYPLMADVIKAIVYPVPSLEACVNASNYSLISCDLTQLRENERASLYTCVLDTLSLIKRRWDVPEFIYEDLYALSIQAKIWDTLLLALMKQRIVNVRTSAAHEYHIWEYLKSHGLDDYSDVLSLKQAMFLYRNLPYLLRNRGSDFNLILLSHKLLSDWNISISGKNILQRAEQPANATDKDAKDLFVDKCTTFPVVDSVVVGKTVLSKLVDIDNNDANYLNKTVKSKDELISFDYRMNDLQQMSGGTIETLQSLYEKERLAKLEYQTDYQFEKSTDKQTHLFRNTPHTSFVTKMLEITRATNSSLFKQIYARFISESLLYRASLGEADYIISFIPSGMNFSLDISVIDAIGLVWYCALRECGWVQTTDIRLNPYMYLTVPYKTEHDPIPEKFYWASSMYDKEKFSGYDTAEILRIVPLTFTLTSDNLPVEALGEYSIVDQNVPYKNWVWSNGTATIEFSDKDSLNQWLLKTPNYVLSTNLKYPYFGWKKLRFNWQKDYVSYESHITVNEYDYLIDRLMRNYPTTDYQSLINMLHDQAVGCVQLYSELHGSDWARQRSGVRDIIASRTVNEVVKIDFFGGKSVKEFIDDSADIKDIIEKIEDNSEEVVRTEYAKFGNSVIKALFPLDTDYLEDNAGVSSARFNRLKELFINLCSYNVAFLEGNVGSIDTSRTLTNFVVQDYDFGETTMTSKSFVSPEELSLDYVHTIGSKYHEGFINSSLSVNPPNTTISIDIGMVNPVEQIITTCEHTEFNLSANIQTYIEEDGETRLVSEEQI